MTDTLKDCYAVIFSAVLNEDLSGYAGVIEEMHRLVAEQPGYLGMETLAEGQKEITVSYWRDLNAIKAWKENPQHRTAQEKGRNNWYESYDIKVVKIDNHYKFQNN